MPDCFCLSCWAMFSASLFLSWESTLSRMSSTFLASCPSRSAAASCRGSCSRRSSSCRQVSSGDLQFNTSLFVIQIKKNDILYLAGSRIGNRSLSCISSETCTDLLVSSVMVVHSSSTRCARADCARCCAWAERRESILKSAEEVSNERETREMKQKNLCLSFSMVSWMTALMFLLSEGPKSSLGVESTSRVRFWPEVTTYELPQPELRYVAVNGLTVVVDVETNKIVRVLR